MNSGIFFTLLFNSSALYYLQTPTRRYWHASTPPQFLLISGDWDVSLPPSFEWHVWLSLSGNNCHAVHRSLSSGASLCSGTVWLGQRSIYNTWIVLIQSLYELCWILNLQVFMNVVMYTLNKRSGNTSYNLPQNDNKECHYNKVLGSILLRGTRRKNSRGWNCKEQFYFNFVIFFCQPITVCISNKFSMKIIHQQRICTN